jgi:uncharacterized membrane protein YeaQ/YmgE (transglycosylase-associated protein family)
VKSAAGDSSISLQGKAGTMETIVNLIIQLISGVVAGNAAGAALKDYNLGNLGNTIAGAIGGVGGGQILQALVPAIASAAAGGDLDLGPSWVKSSAAAPEARSSPSSPGW